MRTQLLLALAAGTLLATTSTAQFCSDNTYPVHIVDAAGNELATEFDATLNEDIFVVPTEEVFLAFDPALPTGTYYVHVTDTPIDGLDEVLSQNDPMDRFVHVENDAGVITLSLPMSPNPDGAVYGAGLGGVGQSLLINPFSASQYSQCRFKVWYGDNWVLDNGPDNPYLLAGGLHPVTGLCAVRSYHSFRIGDGSGSDVYGVVFADADRSGAREAGEAGEQGREVHLVGVDGTLVTTTDPDGSYQFDNVPAGDYTVEVVVPSGYVATTDTTYAVTVCGCAPVAVDDFGIDTESMACNAEPLCFWKSCDGANEAVQAGILPTLPMLCIVNQCGQHVAPSSAWQLRCYLANANSWNMAYALSAQLVAMQANVLTGRVHLECVVCDPCLGQITVEQLLQQAVASLCAHPYTPWCSSHRAAQAALRNALERANENEAWQCGGNTGGCGGGSGGSGGCGGGSGGWGGGCGGNHWGHHHTGHHHGGGGGGC